MNQHSRPLRSFVRDSVCSWRAAPISSVASASMSSCITIRTDSRIKSTASPVRNASSNSDRRAVSAGQRYPLEISLGLLGPQVRGAKWRVEQVGNQDDGAEQNGQEAADHKSPDPYSALVHDGRSSRDVKACTGSVVRMSARLRTRSLFTGTVAMLCQAPARQRATAPGSPQGCQGQPSASSTATLRAQHLLHPAQPPASVTTLVHCRMISSVTELPEQDFTAQKETTRPSS